MYSKLLLTSLSVTEGRLSWLKTTQAKQNTALQSERLVPIKILVSLLLSMRYIYCKASYHSSNPCPVSSVLLQPQTFLDIILTNKRSLISLYGFVFFFCTKYCT